MRYVFADCELNTELRAIRRGSHQRSLRPKPFQVLLYLIEHRDRVISKQELAEQLWPDEYVSDAVIENGILAARRAVGDSGREQRIIQTLHGHGYRFIVTAISVVAESGSDASDPVRPRDLSQVPPLQPTASSDASEITDDLESSRTVAAPAVPSQTAERRQLTILFCGLVGSTALAERLDPEDLNDVLNSYYDVCVDAIASFEGYIAQYQGDGLRVYFGYPHAHEDAARRAVHAGLEMVRSIPELNRRLEVMHGIELSVRIGIHTGLVMIGQGRAGNDTEPSVVGAPLNMASRIQAVATPETVWISESTFPLIEGYFELEEMGLYDLSGVSEPMTLYRVIAARESQHRLDVMTPGRLTPFVGREMERLILREHWEQVQFGEGRVILLSGEAGIGKSRLARDLVEAVSSGPHLLLEGDGSPYHQHTAFYPLVSLLQRQVQVDEHNPVSGPIDALAELVRHCRLEPSLNIPLLAALIGLSIPEDQYPALDLSPQQQRQCTLETLLNLVIALSVDQPVILFIEDGHWLDPSTLEWLSLLVDQGPTVSILTLITCRPEFQAPWSDRAHVTELTLRPFTSSQVNQMVQSIAGQKAVAAALGHQIMSATDGVPLFVEEMTQLVAPSHGAETLEAKTITLSALSDIKIPSTLHDLLMARLDSVGESKRTAQLGATVGREFSYALLQVIAEVEEEQLQADLDTLIAADLLYQRGMGEQVIYQFKHALIHETAYASLLRRTRQQYHQHIAQTLEAQFPQRAESEPELLAYHYTEAGALESAIGYWSKAGQRAAQQSANSEAIVHLQRGLDLLDKLPDTPERAQQELDLLMVLGPALMLVKGWGAAEAEQLYTRAHVLSTHMAETPERFAVLWGLCQYYRFRGDFQTAQELGEQLLAIAQQLQQSDLMLVSSVNLGIILFFMGKFSESQPYLESGDRLPPLEHHRELALTYGHAPGMWRLILGAVNLWFLGYPDQALQKSREALDMAVDLSHPLSQLAALYWMGLLHLFRGDADIAYEQSTSGLQMAEEHGFSYNRAIHRFLQGAALAHQSQYEDGLALMRQGLAEAIETGGEMVRVMYHPLMAELCAQTGRLDEGLRLLAETENESRQRHYEPERYRLEGVLLERRDGFDSESAESSLTQALKLSREREAKSLELRAAMSLSQLWWRQGKRDQARELLEPIYNWFTEGFDTVDLQQAKALLKGWCAPFNADGITPSISSDCNGRVAG